MSAAYLFTAVMFRLENARNSGLRSVVWCVTKNSCW